jgi:hypothetical protein
MMVRKVFKSKLHQKGTCPKLKYFHILWNLITCVSYCWAWHEVTKVLTSQTCWLWKVIDKYQLLLLSTNFRSIRLIVCRSQWPCGLRRGSAAAHLLGLWVRIPPRAWMSVCCECCVLSGRGLWDELVPRPEESYRLWCVSNVCDHETSTKRGGPGPYRAAEP